jgi:hypothetical protein
MTDADTLDRARLLFVGETQGDRLAREVIQIAERGRKKASLWEEIADQREKELATLRAERDELRELLTPLKDAVLFARSQRRPMGIGQDFPRAPACVSIQLGAAYGRERDCVGFWIESDEIAPTDADSPSPCHRIGLALIRLAYAVALVSMTRSKP